MKIFTRKELIKPNFIQKILKKLPSENAVIEINNLLANNEENIEKVTIDHIIEIGNKYKVNLKTKYKEIRIDLFKSYLKHCLNDSKLEEFEINTLRHIREVLILNEKDTDSIIRSETEKIYNHNVKDILSDGELDDEEKLKLEKLKNDLLIPENVANNIFSKNAKLTMQKFIEGVVSDERVSPEEEYQLNKIAKSLGFDLKVDEKSKAILERYKLYWQIENAELPEIISDINIQKSEVLHFKSFVSWKEYRKVTKRINYGGATARIKIAKGLYYKVGSISVKSVSEDILQTIDSGKIYLTNKRLIFMGSKGNKTIQINKILDITPFKNGIDIQKESGKSPFLEFNENVDLFSMILVKLMDEI